MPREPVVAGVSQAIAHFAVGATATALLITLFVPNVRYPRTWIFVGGGWGMVPDVEKLVDHPTVQDFHYSIWADVFWAHGTLDRIDSGDSTIVASAAVAVLLAVTLVAEHRSYRVPEPIAEELGFDTADEDGGDVD